MTKILAIIACIFLSGSQTSADDNTFTGVVKPIPARHFRGSPQQAFPVTVIHVVEGQNVKKGDILLELDPAPIPIEIKKAQLAACKAHLPVLLGKLRQNSRDAKGMRELLKLGYKSRGDMENATIDFLATSCNIQQTTAQIRAAEQALKMANYADQNYSRMLSPIDGIVIGVDVALGQVARAQDNQVFWIEIVDLSAVQVRFWVPLEKAFELREADKLGQVEVRHRNFRQYGKILSVGKTLNDRQQVEVVAEASNPKEHLLINMNVHVTFR